MGELTDYLAGLDQPGRGILEAIRDRTVELVPDAEEGASYGMAALRYRGRPLLAVVQTKDHLSVFPFSPVVVEAVAPQLDGFSLSKGTIRFGVDQPLPAGVVDRIVELRQAEIDTALDR
jgi:uncharacterized protein YdhG (YjbR/CyaY superfamily)